MADTSFTLIIVPDHTAQVRRFRVPKRYVWQLCISLLVLAGLAVAGTAHYFSVARDASENRILREENLALKSQLKSIRERIDHIGATLDRVERFDQKLRAITLLSDPQRNLAMGPTEPSVVLPSSGDNQFTRLTSSENPKALSSRLDKLSAEATRQEQSLQELQAYFQEQKSLLASTPSTWPTRGWVTSDFGQRLDPYTADRVMHAGLDIAGAHGKDIMAPSDGTVVFSGLEGGYGNVMVIDHGYGIKTRYGHLATIRVKAGDKVKRGQVIATMGNTGRSTGPHLHYEVRVNGLPQNPRKFILDE
ncbi:MAG: peptidoglycan DD-metalloendopeptidase family protein [Myxococcales bacterium]|nr:peptidoglycan DD-metalloendopeptidase family protein [Myxococcales bacterium]